jgi:penicillin amidase
MPRLYDPDGGFVATANNAPVPDDYPYPFYGAFASGERALRIRETLATAEAFDVEQCRALQQDTYSHYARRVCTALLRRLAGSTDPAVAFFTGQLAGWDHRYDSMATAPVFFEMFIRAWAARVARERFPEQLAPLMVGQGTVAARLLEADDLAWFAGDKGATIVECARCAVGEVKERFGSDPSGWAWGVVHRAHFRHPLSNPAVADAFDVGPRGVSGAAGTVRNTGLGTAPLFGAASGAEYQLVADLADGRGILAAQNIGQSGQPGSPHYADQFLDWIDGTYHTVACDRGTVEAERSGWVSVEPAGEPGGPVA